MKDASSSKRTRSGARHHRGWRERFRGLLLGPIALLIVFSNALCRRFAHWRIARRGHTGTKQRRTTGLRRSEASVVQFASPASERPARSLGARLALVGTRDVRRRGPATRLLRVHSTAVSAEAHDAVIGNLRRCLSPAAVSAVLDDLNAKGLCGQSQLAAVLNRLVELETCEADLKRALAYGGLAVSHEADVSRRVIKLKFDPVSGRMEWRHRAVRSLEFGIVGPGLLSARLSERRRLRVVIHLDDAGQIIGWDLPSEGQVRHHR